MEIKVIEVDGDLGKALREAFEMVAAVSDTDVFKRVALRTIDRTARESADMMVCAKSYGGLSQDDLAELYTPEDGRGLIASREELEARIVAMCEGPHAHEAVWLEDDAVCFHDMREPGGVERKPFPTCDEHGPLLRTMAGRYVERLGPYWACYIAAGAYALGEGADKSKEEVMAHAVKVYADAGLESKGKVNLSVSEYYD